MDLIDLVIFELESIVDECCYVCRPRLLVFCLSSPVVACMVSGVTMKLTLGNFRMRRQQVRGVVRNPV